MKNYTVSSLAKGLTLSFLMVTTPIVLAVEREARHNSTDDLTQEILYRTKDGSREQDTWLDSQHQRHHPFKPATTYYDSTGSIVTTEEWYKHGILQRRVEYSPHTCLPLSDTIFYGPGTYHSTEFMTDTGIKTKETWFKNFEAERITVYEQKDGLMTYDEWRDDERTTYVTHDSSGTNRVIPILRSY